MLLMLVLALLVMLVMAAATTLPKKSKIKHRKYKNVTKTNKKHLWIHKLWPKPAKMEPLGPVLGIRIIKIELLGTP